MGSDGDWVVDVFGVGEFFYVSCGDFVEGEVDDCDFVVVMFFLKCDVFGNFMYVGWVLGGLEVDDDDFVFEVGGVDGFFVEID